MHLREPFTPSFFKRLQQLKIRTRRAFLGTRQGSHISLRRGHGLEFSDFRPYTAGDDFRHIDWGVYGRSDRLYVRQFRSEQDLNVLVLLDTSASMAYPEGQGKFELARNIALALGYIALCDGDSVVFSLLGLRNTPRFTGQKAISRAMAALNDVQPHGSVDIVREVRAAIAQQKIPGRCFFVSDFLFDLGTQFAALDLLRSRSFEITVIQTIAPGELRLDVDDLQVVVDAETGETVELALDRSSQREYSLKLGQHVEELERYCQRAGITHLLVSSEEKLSDVVLTRFPEMGVLK
ncbi:MAG: DUF58 domain-containing protein [Bdellovibrionota bacterium]